MSQCIDQVPGASRDEVVEALKLSDWNTAISVERLKIQQLVQYSPSRWKFGALQNSPVCRRVLKVCKWDLEEATSIITGARRNIGPNHTQVENTKYKVNYFPTLSTRSLLNVLTVRC